MIGVMNIYEFDAYYKEYGIIYECFVPCKPKKYIWSSREKESDISTNDK